MVQFSVNKLFLKEEDKEDEEDNTPYANYYFSILLLLHSSILYELTLKETWSREMMILFIFQLIFICDFVSTHFDLQKGWFMFGCESLSISILYIISINKK